ncbi:thiol-disulfide oxidoreductase DCC family protein [Paenibacillus spiritus]|uniref:Thiol-disulfide oxidoreductase DCC family protein n=1 Tax=Paenibacillus spiritus TaxID=2496557 RepID=A0A5J5GBP0_9BACL|nr:MULTISPECIES: thiol-disulfide oxidoreductase DCC family protein [Paenibacillus]KAA9004914.1 thiol-disulfide oxidoreductase DCC family protein [Paenibacillus spiritus]
MNDASPKAPAGPDGPVVLIDGVCHLCQWAVRFIIPRDPAGKFRFAALQSAAGASLLRSAGLAPGRMDSVVLVEDGRAYTDSAAALRIARGLRNPWPLLYGFMLVPRPVRDAAYRFVARNRYRWFGRDESCLLPAPGIRDRFLPEEPEGPPGKEASMHTSRDE